MQYLTIPRFKICCIANLDEAWLAIRYGASAVGLVSEMPSGPGVISDETITEIARGLPPGISSFLLTSKQDADQIIAQQKKCGVNTIQLCDRLETGGYRDLRRAMPGIALVQVIHVTGPESIEEARSVAPMIDAILLDSGNQSLAVKELGGAGRTHDWKISKKICESIDKPLFLAGGLNASNVSEAINHVGPYGVDVCSGVRTQGKLDEEKLADFVKSINACKK